MTLKIIKRTVAAISLLGLIINATPLFAWTIDIEILGEGYKIDTASVINFPEINASTSDTVSDVYFNELQDAKNYVLITDENGNNPYDVTVSASQLKREETFSSTVIAGSSGNILKLNNTAGLVSNDTITINGLGNQIFTVITVTDSQTIKISPAMTAAPSIGATVSSIVNCDISPKKCISLNNLKIMSSDPIIINGSTSSLNTLPYQTFQAFGGETTTTADSTGNTLNLSDPTVFQNNESIDLINSDGSVSSFNITSINAESVSIDGNIPSALPAGLKVRSSNSRALTLAKGAGGEAGQYKIFPRIETTVKAGQKPGKYISTLYLSIF